MQKRVLFTKFFISGYLKSKQIYEFVFVYDDVLSNPQLAMEKMFQALKIPLELLPIAMTAFDKHSQNMWLKPNNEVTFLNQDKIKVDAIYSEFKVPIRHEMTLNEFLGVLELK